MAAVSPLESFSKKRKKAAANAILTGGPFLTSFLRKRWNEVPEKS
jgi:hypothetical protein